jgi:hypothetical protein
MKYFKIIIFGGVLALLASVAPGLCGIHAMVAKAQTDVASAATLPAADPASASGCTISATDLAQLSAIQNDPTLSSSEEIKAELALRQKLVGETITCAQQDVQTLQAVLASTTVDSNSQALQSELSGQLDNVTTFYNLELTKLNGSGISGTQAIAKEVLEERTGAFAPLADQVNNFILWTQNQALFDTAQTRMDQTSRAVAFLESATPNAALQTAFNAALASFTTAQSQNAQAKAALLEGLPASQSLMLIKQSLDSLSTTYQNFSTIGTLIKNILPQ